MSGYEYMVVGYCQRTGRQVLRPIAWSSEKPMPLYYSCPCHDNTYCLDSGKRRKPGWMKEHR